MIKKSIQKLIPKIQEYFDTQPILKAWLFGSCARGENRRNSDVDILVQYDRENTKMSLFTIVRIMNGLEDIINKKVDLVEDGCLMNFAVKSVEHDKILIYERGNKGCWKAGAHSELDRCAVAV